MDKSKRIATYKRIFEVLVENDNGFLTVQEIADRVFGASPTKAHNDLNLGLVKRNIAHAAAEAERNGMMIVPQREAVAKRYFIDDDGEKQIIEPKLSKFKILGYKIADTSDMESIEDVIQHAVERKQSALTIQQRVLSNVKDQSLLPTNHKMLN